jgi:hypothetical protein
MGQTWIYAYGEWFGPISCNYLWYIWLNRALLNSLPQSAKDSLTSVAL